jgi:formamidopyrimidine-DNA glycosylase
MPELPEVETIVRDLRKNVTGSEIKAVRFLNNSVWRNAKPESRTLIGRKIEEVGRKGKHILIHLSGGRTLVVHLKMTGRLTYEGGGSPVAKHTHLILILNGGEMRFNDIRRFGYLDLAKSSQLDDMDYLRQLGPDPLMISEQEFTEIVRGRRKMIKALLLDQNVVSGLGNIYSDEALFAAGIYPARVSSRISKVRAGRLHHVIVKVLKAAIRARGSSVDDYVDGSGKRGSFQNYLKVYGRGGEPCVKCGTTIKRRVIGSRSAHFCPRCQR